MPNTLIFGQNNIYLHKNSTIMKSKEREYLDSMILTLEDQYKVDVMLMNDLTADELVSKSRAFMYDTVENVLSRKYKEIELNVIRSEQAELIKEYYNVDTIEEAEHYCNEFWEQIIN